MRAGEGKLPRTRDTVSIGVPGGSSGVAEGPENGTLQLTTGLNEMRSEAI